VISLQIVTEFVYKNFEKVTVSKNNTHFHARCALCGDSKKNARKKRFHLDWKLGSPVFQCWNCGEAGSFIRLYSLIKGISEEDVKREIFSIYNADSLRDRLVRPVTPPTLPKSDLPVFNHILKDCATRNLPVNSFAYPAWLEMLDRFRADRKIPDHRPLYYAYKGEYQGRIIIPVEENGNIIYFQARRRFDDDDSVVKYKNPATEKVRIILNRNSFNPEKNIIVTEGLIDAFMVEENQGTTMLGKEVSKEFVNELFKLTKKNVIIAFDFDTEGIKSLRKHLKSITHPRLKFFIMPREYMKSKDINKTVIDYNIPNVYDFIVENSFTKERCAVLLLGGRDAGY